MVRAIVDGSRTTRRSLGDRPYRWLHDRLGNQIAAVRPTRVTSPTHHAASRIVRGDPLLVELRQLRGTAFKDRRSLLQEGCDTFLAVADAGVEHGQ